MKKIHANFIAAIAVISLMGTGSAFGQKNIIEAAEKLQSVQPSGVSMTNVVKRDSASGTVRSTILEVKNLPAKYAKAMIRAIEKDESKAYDESTNLVNGYCTKVLKFASKNSRISVVIQYNVKNKFCYSLVVRQDYSPAAKKRVEYIIGDDASVVIYNS